MGDRAIESSQYFCAATPCNNDNGENFRNQEGSYFEYKGPIYLKKKKSGANGLHSLLRRIPIVSFILISFISEARYEDL